MGYSDRHKGYKCFHPPTQKKFISRHVVFDETNFPFKKSQGHDSVFPADQWMSIFDSWTTLPISQTNFSPMSTGNCESCPPSPNLPPPNTSPNAVIEPEPSTQESSLNQLQIYPLPLQI